MDIVEHPETLFPKKDSILFSKDGSVGIAYKLEEDAQFITSSALLQLTVRDTKIILPDYLTLVLNSPVVQLQAERAASGAVIQHWKPSEIQQVIIPVLDMPEQRKLSQMVQQSFSLRRQSEQLLDCAKHAVELAIEQGEDVAIEWLKEKGGNG
jgi:restriction endonuclease S subunit